MYTAIIVAFISAITAIITAIISVKHARKQALAVEKLKAALEQERTEVNSLITWMVAYDTDMIHQYSLHAKEFLSEAQYAKDRLRDIADTFHNRFTVERINDLLSIKDAIITKYAGTRYYFDKTPYKESAHLIKSRLLLIIKEMLTAHVEVKTIYQWIDDISAAQRELHMGMEAEIKQLCNDIRSKVRRN
jgi:hypothetical protein